MIQEKGGWCEDRTCRSCGKKFTVPQASIWQYKKRRGKVTLYFCTWSCMRAFERKEEEMKMNKAMRGRAAKARAAEGAEEQKAAEEQREAETEKAGTDMKELEEVLRVAAEPKTLINGIEPLEVAAVYSRVMKYGTFKKVQGGMVLSGMDFNIILSAYEWFRLSEEILVALRQLDASRPVEVDGE